MLTATSLAPTTGLSVWGPTKTGAFGLSATGARSGALPSALVSFCGAEWPTLESHPSSSMAVQGMLLCPGKGIDGYLRLTVYVVGGSACLTHASWGTLDNLGFPRGPWGPSKDPAIPDIGSSTVVQGESLVGVQWQPDEFIQEAVRRGHPKRLFSGVPPVLERVIRENASSTEADVARWRTEQLRRWTLRAQELQNEEATLKDSLAPHLRKILSPKRLCLMREMIQETGYGDVGLFDDLCKGFEVTGEIPRSNVYRVSPAYATLSPAELRAKAALTRKCIIDSVEKACTSDLAADVYAATQEEVKNGWLDGPLDADALDPCVSVTRRFGVRQGTGESARVRPIDNFTESLVSHTTFREETIEPHTVDVVCASLAMRLRARHDAGKSSDTVLKATDLRKAYKQLGVSENALLDSHLAVANPATGRAEVYMSKVLPFGSCSAVNGFCRASSCLLVASWSVAFSFRVDGLLRRLFLFYRATSREAY